MGWDPHGVARCADVYAKAPAEVLARAVRWRALAAKYGLELPAVVIDGRARPPARSHTRSCRVPHRRYQAGDKECMNL